MTDQRPGAPDPIAENTPLAATTPDHDHDRIDWLGEMRGLVLMSARPRAASPGERLRMAALSTVLRTVGPRPLTPAIMAGLYGASFRGRAPEAVATTAARIAATTRRDLGWSVRAWAQRPTLMQALVQLEAPTRVVVGAEDAAAVRRSGELIARAVAGASLHVVAGAGHSVQVEQPAAVAAVIDGLLAQLLA